MRLNLFSRHRAALGAAFHWDAVKGFAKPFYNKTIELLKVWAAEGSKPVEVTDVLPKFTLDVLGACDFLPVNISLIPISNYRR